MAGVQLDCFPKGVLRGPELLLPEHHHAKGVIDRRFAVVDLASTLQRFKRFGIFPAPVILGAKSKMRIKVIFVLDCCLTEKRYAVLGPAFTDLRNAFRVSRASRLRHVLYKTGGRGGESRPGLRVIGSRQTRWSSSGPTERPPGPGGGRPCSCPGRC